MIGMFPTSSTSESPLPVIKPTQRKLVKPESSVPKILVPQLLLPSCRVLPEHSLQPEVPVPKHGCPELFRETMEPMETISVEDSESSSSISDWELPPSVRSMSKHVRKAMIKKQRRERLLAAKKSRAMPSNGVMIQQYQPNTGLWREAAFKVFCAICFFAASKVTYKQFLTQKKQVSYPKCI